MRAPPGPVTGLFAGRYTIERVLGQGATATVHLARDTVRGTAVALKILRPELAESAASGRFLKEIRRTSSLQHPYILPVLDSGEAEGLLYFALPYMEGGTLRHLLKREKSLALERVVEIARTIAEALDYANARGLIHRDVKPENILFTNGKACLGDFGIARALEMSGGGGDTTSTSKNTVRGTPAYMSPEQAAGGTDLDGRSDVYSLACVLYEMVTGMQAFIGPTPEQVISQRFAFPPREIRVYRPTAPTSIDAVLGKAFAMTPADRHRTAGELVKELEAAILTASGGPIIERRPTPKGWRATEQQKWLAMASAVILVAAISTAIVVPQIRDGTRVSTGDTTRLVVLPLERDTANVPPWSDDDLLQQALSRWRGVSVVDQFQIADAVSRQGGIKNSDDARAVARSLGAGRYIRGKLTSLDQRWLVSTSLYDAALGRTLHRADESVPRDLTGAMAAYARVASALLLRGMPADSTPSNATSTRSLPAVQAFNRAQAALDDWDLARAESGFEESAGLDPEYARANLWLAQVRAWQGLPGNSWATPAERAAARIEQLNEREKQLTHALVDLSKQVYGKACATYEILRKRDNRDFAAWFGKGQCLDMDHAVIRDTMSQSGWRFRSSYYRATIAYKSALTLLPIAHRGLEQFSYVRLQRMLYTTHSLYREGIAAHTDTLRFFSRGEWRGDSVVFVPYPVDRIPPTTSEVAASVREAVTFGRGVFHDVAASWATALPQSVGAKEALAVSLEMQSDPAAIDTLQSARRLATTLTVRRRLAAKEAILLVKFGFPDEPTLLRKAKALADSLLSAAESVTPSEARSLVPIAALIGDCNRLADLKRFAAEPRTVLIEASKQAVGDWEASEARAALGCVPTLSLDQLTARIWGPDVRASTAQRRSAEAAILARIVLLGEPHDAAWVERLAPRVTGNLFAALNSTMKGDTARARILLALPLQSRLPGELTPDAILPSARIWLKLGDSTTAVALLDRILGDVRFLAPGILDSPVQLGPLMRIARLRGRIAAQRNDLDLSWRLNSAVLTLWSSSDLQLASPLK